MFQSESQVPIVANGHAKQAIEIEDVEVRVAALEQAAELSKSSGRNG